MTNLWTLGGLSLRELLRRTLSASWHDAVFGQAGRMAFYHFLAIFPSLVVFLAIVARFPTVGPQLKDTITGLVNEFLPREVASLSRQMLNELDTHMPLGLHFLMACAGALWAALNGTWALVYGLNTAYEVEEHRAKWKLGATVVGLTLSLTLAGSVALLVLFFGVRIAEVLSSQALSFTAPVAALRALEWLSVLVLLMVSFAVVYRFGPNLRDHKWKWSTPGALCALLLWVGSTVAVRFYFERVNDYTRTYGHLNSVVMLLLWLYLTNGAILIGGEMNSEIEKAVDQPDDSHRSGS